MQERANLLEEIEKKNVASIVTADNESQTDEQEDGKLTETNKKLKRALHKIKNQIERIVKERPELFDGIGEDSNERLEHLITVVAYQAAQIDALQAEHDHVEEELRDANKELQRYKTIFCNTSDLSAVLIFLALLKHMNIKWKVKVQ